MDQSSGSGRRPPQPPRKELQGPRPSPLKVRKDSHKIKKPPPVPPPNHQVHPPPQPPLPRPPIIIYAISPKIIHTNPSDFMTLVQRLTGADNSTATSNPPPSPAARYAAIEKTKTPPAAKSTILDHTAGFESFEHLLGTRPGSSILSPGPAGLTHPVPPAFFSDPFSPLINLYHQHQHDHLNALQQLQNSGAGNYTYNGGSTPSTAANAAAFLSPSTMLSPASIEFLTRLLEH